MTDEGMAIKNFSLIFRELFCIAAADMAADIGKPMEQLGFLYDEIINTGVKGPEKKVFRTTIRMVTEKASQIIRSTFGKRGKVIITRPSKTEEQIAASLSTGQLLVLTKMVDRRQVEELQAIGYRFASTSNVLPVLTRTLQIKTEDLTYHLNNLWECAYTSHIFEPGVHLGCFGLRASIRGGFDVLVPRDAKNLLPTMQLPLADLKDWQEDYLKGLDSLNTNECIKFLKQIINSTSSEAPQER